MERWCSTMLRIKWFSIIRTLGVCLVLVYHFYQSLLPAGFFGVDVFFTFSGYLITMLIIESFLKEEGRFRFFGYLRRRFLRIFPPLLFSVLLTLPFVLLISPDFTVGIGQQIVSVLSFSSNYFEIFTGGSYEAQLLPHLYLHTWSLAVEMHFYLVWGIIFTLIAFMLKRLYRKSPQTGLKVIKCLILVVALVLAALSYWYMQTIYAENTIDPSAAYFGTLTRGLPFMMGASAGVIIGIRPPESFKSIRASVTLAVCGIVLAVSGIVALAWALDFTSEITYRYGFIAVSLLTIVIIKCALVLHGASQKIREPRILAAVSNMSYSIYLFHWPLFIVFSYTFESVLLAAAATLVLSLAFSYIVDYVLQPRVTKIGAEKKPPLQGEPRHPVLRTLGRASMTWLLASALLINVAVFARAPEISSLEAELYAGYLYQDVDEINELERLTQAINGEPLALFAPQKRDDTLEDGQYLPNPAIIPSTPIAPPIVLPDKIGDDVLGGVVVVGDSVCLGARSALTNTIPNCYVDAQGSRNLSQGYNLLMQWQTADRLREYVVVALGTNADNNYIQRINQIIADIQPGTRLIFVTPYDGRWSSSWISYKTTQYLRSLSSTYSFVTVADWAAAIEPNANLLGADKLHIGGNSTLITMYVNCIVDAINVASQKPEKP